MKKLTTILFLFCFTNLIAGESPNYIVSSSMPNATNGSAPAPVENISSKLWAHIHILNCINITDTQVVYSDNDIHVFTQYTSGPCWSPPPPPVYVERVDISGLSIGTYTLNNYNVPIEDTFPPNSANYPDYFVESHQFNVQGALGTPVTVNSSSYYSLMIMGLLIFIIAFYNFRFNAKQQ